MPVAKWHPHEVRIHAALFDRKGEDVGGARIRFIHGRSDEGFPITGYGGVRRGSVAYGNPDDELRERIFTDTQGIYIVTVAKVADSGGKGEGPRPPFEQRLIDALERALVVARVNLERRLRDV